MTPITSQPTCPRCGAVLTIRGDADGVIAHCSELCGVWSEWPMDSEYYAGDSADWYSPDGNRADIDYDAMYEPDPADDEDEYDFDDDDADEFHDGWIEEYDDEDEEDDDC